MCYKYTIEMYPPINKNKIMTILKKPGGTRKYYIKWSNPYSKR